MHDADTILARYDRLAAWVEDERTRLEDAGEGPDQTLLRRARLCADIDRTTLAELVSELASLPEQSPRT